MWARTTISRLLWLALVAVEAAGCGSGEQQSDTDGEKKSAPAGKGQAAAEARPSVVDRLAEAVRESEAAIAERDWPRARKAIETGLALAREGGYEYEIDRAYLLLLRGDVERDAGGDLDSRRYYADSMAIYRVQGSDVGRFMVHLSQGQLEAMHGDYAAAAREYAAAEALLGGVEDQALKGEYLLETGRLAARQMRHEDALAAYTEAARTFDIIKDQGSRAEALMALAGEEDALGKERQGRRSLDKALAIFRDIGDREGEVRALHKAAGLAERDKQYKKARKLLKKVRELYLLLDRQSDATKVLQHMNALPE